MSRTLSREAALRVLALSSSAGRDDIKRAYRHLAREHHPDRGGDPDTFHEIVRAFERLAGDDTPPQRPVVARGRPSRPAPSDRSTALADLHSVDWSLPVPPIGTRLDRDRLAIALARVAPIAPVAATSRSPGSRLNSLAPHLAADTAATLTVAPDADDRGRPLIAVQLRANARRARRALDAADLLGRWTRIRGSSTTLLRTTFVPDEDPRASAVVASDRTAALLDSLGWHLSGWTLTAGDA